MAISKKCDRCGALYEIYNAKRSSEKINGVKLLNMDHRQAYFEHGPYDLCPECSDEFMWWFKQEREDISRYKTLFEDHSILKNDFDSLRKRFRHLLESKFIASFDEWNPKTNDYKRNISEADEIFNKFILEKINSKNISEEESVADITNILMVSDSSNAKVYYNKLAKAVYDAGYRK